VQNLEKRLTLLEQAAKLSAAQPKPHTPRLSSNEFMKKIDEILTRERPPLSEEELIKKVRAGYEKFMNDRALWVGRWKGEMP
jgi:hypothetical protein